MLKRRGLNIKFVSVFEKAVALTHEIDNHIVKQKHGIGIYWPILTL
jgi:hypothetical protein